MSNTAVAEITGEPGGCDLEQQCLLESGRSNSATDFSILSDPPLRLCIICVPDSSFRERIDLPVPLSHESEAGLMQHDLSHLHMHGP